MIIIDSKAGLFLFQKLVYKIEQLKNDEIQNDLSNFYFFFRFYLNKFS